MSDDHSDVGATENEADHADMTDDGEVKLNLPRETVEEQIRTSEDIRLLLMRLPWPVLGYCSRPTLLGFTIGVAPLAVGGPVIMAVAGVADAGILFPADLAGPVTVGVAGLADAGILFPADLAGTATVEVACLANAEEVTVGVTDLADAGMALPADPAGAVTIGVAPLAVADLVTTSVTNGVNDSRD